jgi:hypothetical protein
VICLLSEPVVIALRVEKELCVVLVVGTSTGRVLTGPSSLHPVTISATDTADAGSCGGHMTGIPDHEPERPRVSNNTLSLFI